MTAIRVGRVMLSFFVSSWIIIHLGRNPVSGGRPPSDSIIARMDAANTGILFHRCDRDSVVVDALVMNSMKVVVVIRMYRTRLSSAMVGL